MLRLILLILFSFALTAVSANDEIKCNPDGNQLEINACASFDFSKADNELNETYQAIIKKEANDKLFISIHRVKTPAF